MKRFEYKKYHSSVSMDVPNTGISIEKLNEFGSQGWRLINERVKSTFIDCIFEREIKE